MNRPKLTAKAQAIDTRKDKLLYAGTALLIGLFAASLFSPAARAQTAVVKDEEAQNSAINTNKADGEWAPHIKPHEELKLPFELKSQKLSH